jgi:hypothetical protein
MSEERDLLMLKNIQVSSIEKWLNIYNWNKHLIKLKELYQRTLSVLIILKLSINLKIKLKNGWIFLEKYLLL